MHTFLGKDELDRLYERALDLGLDDMADFIPEREVDEQTILDLITKHEQRLAVKQQALALYREQVMSDFATRPELRKKAA